MEERVQELLTLAKAAKANAYAPFSRFQVGCAVRCASGRIYSGCNMENSSYGVTVCAERIAIGAAITAGERELVELLVVTQTEPPARPCGVCRQTIVEFGPRTTVYLASTTSKIIRTSAEELLPNPFILKP